MAAIGKSGPVKQNRTIKPGLSNVRNWTTAQIRAARYSQKAFWRLCLSVLTVFIFVVFGALWLGGYLPQAKAAAGEFTQSRLMAMGFEVSEIDVVGEGRLREADVLTALGVSEGDYLFAFDVSEAQSRVESLSWVDRALVRRLWPDRIVVQIIERQPYALWQTDGQLHLIDKDGEVMADVKPGDFPGLPLIVGAQAAEAFPAMDLMLAEYADVQGRVKSLVYLPTGRWDVKLDAASMTVKLPQENMRAALTRLQSLQEGAQILDREISVIDLRLPDRVTFSPNPQDRA